LEKKGGRKKREGLKRGRVRREKTSEVGSPPKEVKIERKKSRIQSLARKTGRTIRGE